MVFFQQQLSRTIVVHPMFLGPALSQHVKDQLVAEVEGTPVDNSGFIVTGVCLSRRRLGAAQRPAAGDPAAC